MKKFISIMLIGAMALSMTACGGSKNKEETEATTQAATIAPGTTILTVFAASSTSEALNQIAKKYEENNPYVTISYNFDSSDLLKTQIEGGSDCDIFISADSTQLDELDINADSAINTDGLDFINTESRINLLENKTVLVTQANNPRSIKSFDDLSKHLEAKDIQLCLADSSATVSRQAKEILSYYKLDENVLVAAGIINYEASVRDVGLQLSDGYFDASIVYSTDAKKLGLNVVDAATADMCTQVLYPAAIMKNASNVAAAQEFLAYLQTDDAMQCFEAIGFSAAE